MTAALGAFGDDGIHAQRGKVFSQNGRCHHGDDLDTGFLPHGDVLAGVAAPVVTTLTPSSTTILANSSAWGCISMMLTPNGLSVSFFASRIFIPNPLCRCRRCSDEAKAAGLGNCRCQMMLRHPGHAALNDWILNPE